MNTNSVRLMILAGGFCLPFCPFLAAPADSGATGLQQALDVLQQHQAMAAAIVAGSQTAEAVLAQLKAQPALPGDPDASLASAAADLGHRLWAAGRAADASVFFAAAEESLSKKVNATSDAAALLKAHYLATRAILRAQFLNKAALAKADLDAALKLAPNDRYLVSLRAALASDKAEQFRETPGS